MSAPLNKELREKYNVSRAERPGTVQTSSGLTFVCSCVGPVDPRPQGR